VNGYQLGSTGTQQTLLWTGANDGVTISANGYKLVVDGPFRSGQVSFIIPHPNQLPLDDSTVWDKLLNIMNEDEFQTLETEHIEPEEAGQCDLFAVTDWLRKGAKVGKVFASVEPLFWLLNSITYDLESAQRIKKWTHQLAGLSNLKTKSRKSDRSSFADLWNDLINSVSMTLPPVDGAASLAGTALSCMGATLLLPKIFELTDDEATFGLLQPLIAEASQRQLTESESPIQPWVEQMLAVELPLSLVTHFPDLVVGDDSCEPAIEWMSGIIDERLDETGWPAAELLPIFGPLVASWTRSYFMLSKLHWEFDEAVLRQLRGSIRHVLRLLRPDGRLMFTDGNSMPIRDACLNKLLKLSGDSNDKAIAKLWSSGGSSKKRVWKKSVLGPGMISSQCHSAILRSHWRSGAARVGLIFENQTNVCEIGAQTTLIAGSISPFIEFNGEKIGAVGQFEVACEELDEDVDYVELQLDLSQGLSLTRQWLLAREEEILFFADSLTAPQIGQIDYRCGWPLADGIAVMPETETQELYLTTRKIQALVLPLSLAEWKGGTSSPGTSNGKLNFDSLSNCLEISDSVIGAGLCMPLVFDLNPKRSRQKRTWRQLTVAESRKQVPRTVAAAFRFQIGKEQWFSYRAISSKGVRTFFGEHFSGEFVFGRFKKSGEIKELLRIE
jgi:hypothetical protein